MSRVKSKLMKVLKDGRAIASGLLVQGRKPGLQGLSPHAFQGKFQRFYLILMVSALIHFGSCKFNLVNVYAPNTVRRRKVFV